jgi:hypothetical protein
MRKGPSLKATAMHHQQQVMVRLVCRKLGKPKPVRAAFSAQLGLAYGSKPQKNEFFYFISSSIPSTSTTSKYVLLLLPPSPPHHCARHAPCCTAPLPVVLRAAPRHCPLLHRAAACCARCRTTLLPVVPCVTPCSCWCCAVLVLAAPCVAPSATRYAAPRCCLSCHVSCSSCRISPRCLSWCHVLPPVVSPSHFMGPSHCYRTAIALHMHGCVYPSCRHRAGTWHQHVHPL